MTGSTTSPDGRETGTQAYGIAPPGYRLPAATRLGAVRLQVADLARSLGGIGGASGWSRSSGSGPVACLGVRGADGPLVELHERPGAAPGAASRAIGPLPLRDPAAR